MAARRLTAAETRAIQALAGPAGKANLRRAIQALADPDFLRRGIQDIIETIRGAKHPTMADLMRGITIDIDPSRDRRFDALKKPFVFEHPAGASQEDVGWAALKATVVHRAAMMRLLRAQFDLPSEGSLSQRQTNVLLAAVLKTYVPALGKIEYAPTRRPRGRPATGLTAGQKAFIAQEVANGGSVRSACRSLARRSKDKEKKANALAVAWYRDTKRK
jgi:hypothetical protein